MRSILLFWTFLFLSFAPLRAQRNDTLICNRIFSYVFEHKLFAKPIGDIVVEIGKQCIGKQYEAHTLDRSTDERLVINLHSFDCVTFIENVIALARCVKTNQLSFVAYQEELRRIRYRGGVLADYSSRLHYFSEWIADGERKGFVQDVTKSLGGIQYSKEINFMTTNRSSYPQLSQDSMFRKMKSIEVGLRTLKFLYLPQETIRAAEPMIRNGDIVGITTTIAGLDITHTGIAVRIDDGSLHYMHAPDVNGSVTISTEPLWKYISKKPKNSGIMIARPVDFSE